ncbi:MAG: MlaD family protein [Sulfurimonas sp.]|uniref:MlaD family protein n=1 Tax=Sulfurimonas sp. TaxID=2022749 RepID=UPI0028CF2A1B|nr:MlaD family protein [Sulfurimonas sp.]MDT8338788.1 MlaD family protein [Sulfurimonas sp.]
MNNRVNYVVIGILVLIGIAGMALFGYWLLKPTQESEMQRYAIYFNESVLGLNLDAPVKYKGLNVGKVVNLGISKSNSEQVEVLVEILKDTPIKTSTEAQLTSQGITGLSYINLTINGDIDAKPLRAKENEEYPVIKSVPSILIKLENRFIDISEDLADTLQKTSRLLSDKNQDEITTLLKNSTLMISKINSMLDDNTTQNFRQTMKNLKSASEKIDMLIPRVDELVIKSGRFEDNISAAFDSIKNSYLGIQDSINTFSEAIESGEFNIKEITGDMVPTMNNALLDMQNLILKIQETINRYERSPADIVFTQEEIKKGPGEK